MRLQFANRKEFLMFEFEKELLKKLCQKSNPARQAALEDEFCFNGVRYENWNNMALVVPSAAEKVIVLCAHFDAVEMISRVGNEVKKAVELMQIVA